MVEAELTELCLSFLEDKVVSVEEENAHACQLDVMLAHGILHLHLSPDTLKHHLI